MTDKRDPGQQSPSSGRSVGVGTATRDYRTHLMKEFMDDERLDALAFCSPYFFRYASNLDMDVSGFERPAICIVPRDGPPFAVLHELSENHWRMSRSSGRLWLDDVTFYSEHPRVERRLPLSFQWDELVASKLEKRGLKRGRLGTDGGSLTRVSSHLPGLSVCDTGRGMQRLRWIKHDEELAVMREAAALADWTQTQYRENIRPGRLVAELDATMASLMAREAARRMPGTELAIYCWTLSGPVSASPHGVCAFGNLAGAAIGEGDVLITCVYPAIDGLFVENERTWICGTPSKRQTLLFEAAREANQAACAAAIAGTPIWSIDAAAQAVFERAGLADLICHRTGHGLGLGGHDYPVDMPFNGALLQDNMVFSVEPGIYEYGLGGFRHDDTVIVGSKPTLLTNTPRDLRSQTIR